MFPSAGDAREFINADMVFQLGGSLYISMQFHNLFIFYSTKGEDERIEACSVSLFVKPENLKKSVILYNFVQDAYYAFQGIEASFFWI